MDCPGERPAGPPLKAAAALSPCGHDSGGGCGRNRTGDETAAEGDETAAGRDETGSARGTFTRFPPGPGAAGPFKLSSAGTPRSPPGRDPSPAARR